jgi:hypothetical protein
VLLLFWLREEAAKQRQRCAMPPVIRRLADKIASSTPSRRRETQQGSEERKKTLLFRYSALDDAGRQAALGSWIVVPFCLPMTVCVSCIMHVPCAACQMPCRGRGTARNAEARACGRLDVHAPRCHDKIPHAE